MPISPKEYQEFETLVHAQGKHTEVECGNYLHYASAALLPVTPVDVGTIKEVRNYFGASDFVITAVIRDGLNEEHNYAYLWEVKAPQCSLFERDDNNNRYRPTKDLIKAENQLIHYGYEAQQSDLFRQNHRIMDRNKIKLGGIVIGLNDSNFVQGVSSDENIRKAKMSLTIRDNYFYGPNSIRLFTWDTILSFCKP